MTDNARSRSAALTSTSEQCGRRYRNESNVKVDLSQLIDVLGYGPVETEHSIPGGAIDIYVPHHRVIIETKARGLAADPHKPQGADRESPKEQLDRYVLSEIRTELSTFDWDPEDRSKQPWVGVVTDGTIWHIWRYPHEENPEVETIPAKTTSDADALIDALSTAFGTERAGKPWVPTAPADLFRNHEKRLESLYRQLPRAVQTGTETKRQLWLDMLRVSGIAPHDNDANRLFVIHSLLIAIARLVAHGLTRDRADWFAALDDGFVSWITDSRPGREWAGELRQTVEEHDWKRRRHDVMQSLYMDFVSARDRKVFGEYYTPDWLAALIVQEALDEVWRSRAIEQAETSARTGTRLEGIGVLDPTCGSGTFLYHAARRILEAPEMGQLSPGQQADVTASLVHGIDVHPVAVEIAKTNMMRVLPTTPRAGAAAIQIRMGDSLMADNQSTSIFDVEGTMRIVTPKRRQISLPMSFVRRSSFAEDMGRVVSAAVDEQPIAPAVLLGLNTADREDLKRARDELAETIDDEGNSVLDVVRRQPRRPPSALRTESRPDRRQPALGEALRDPARAPETGDGAVRPEPGDLSGREAGAAYRHRRLFHQAISRTLPPEPGERPCDLAREEILAQSRPVGRVPGATPRHAGPVRRPRRPAAVRGRGRHPMLPAPRAPADGSDSGSDAEGDDPGRRSHEATRSPTATGRNARNRLEAHPLHADTEATSPAAVSLLHGYRRGRVPTRSHHRSPRADNRRDDGARSPARPGSGDYTKIHESAVEHRGTAHD